MRRSPRHFSALALLGLLTAVPASAASATPSTGTTPIATPAPDAPALTLSASDLAIAEIPAIGTASTTRFNNLFRPFRTEAAALSPDGQRLAYSLREGDNLYVITVKIDDPSRPLARILAGTTRTSTPFMEVHASEKTPARIRWMGWATADRLLIETNANLVTDLTNTSGGIFAVNADGSNPRTLVTPRDVSLAASLSRDTAPIPSSFSDSRIYTPDIDPVEARKAEANAFAATTYGLDNDLPTDLRSPRTPTFFDYAPGEPDWIIIRTSDPRHYGLYRVNIATGQFRYGPTENVSGDYATLINRQGVVGGVVPNSSRSAFPHTFQVAKASPLSLGRWLKLSALTSDTATDFTLSPDNFFGQRSFPIGFDENPHLLYYATNVGRDTYAIRGLDLKTGLPAGRTIESTAIDLATPGPDGLPAVNPLVFDRHTRSLAGIRYQASIRSAIWLRPDLQDIQASLEKILPGRSIDILEWDKSATRYLALVRGPTEPGSFYIVDRTARRALEFVRRSELPAASEPRFSRHFSIENPAGGQLTGFVVIPNAVRQKPIPTVVICADEPWQQAPAEFDGEINALAQMGFAVVQINPRGTWGFGTRHRSPSGAPFDEIQTADIVATIDALAKTLPLHRARVALMGRGRGGFLALRAAQLRPDRFRCVIGLDPTVNLSSWINYTRWTTSDSAPALARAFFSPRLIDANPLFKDDRPHKCPAFILAYRGNEGGSPTQMYLDARSLARAIENDGTPVQFKNLTFDYSRHMPEARSDTMRHIEDFLNLNIYTHDVQMGDAKITGTW
ncbi:alpha/beta hydrolase family protein [Nibricoccus aquaticus]|nr:prolyl oligopeptidase family serine peptidase [Nibricoccus aquaticus]